MMDFYISSTLEEMNTVMPTKYTGSGNRQITEIHKILIKKKPLIYQRYTFAEILYIQINTN